MLLPLFMGLHHHAAANPSYMSLFIHHMENGQESQLGQLSHRLGVIKLSGVSKQQEEIVSIESEDDNPVFVRKQVLLVKTWVTLVYTFTLICFFNQIKKRLSFYRCFPYIFSHKYLLQGILRI